MASVTKFFSGPSPSIVASRISLKETVCKRCRCMSLCPALHEAAVKVASSDHFTYPFNSLMDHLPYPEDAVYPRIQVPYLATEAVAVYHGDNFVDFPVQAGWGEGDGDWFDCEPSLAAARAQSWLFFGLLREVVGPTFSEASFIARDGEHNDFVSTKTRLPLLLRKRFRAKEPLLRMMYEGPCHFILLLIITLGTILFIAELRHRISGAAKKLRWKYRIAMIKAEDEVRSIEAAFPDCDDVHLVCLSIRALLWSLRNAVASRDFTIVKRSSLELSSSPYLKHLLIERGMCPHHLATIDERSSVVTLHYLAGLARPIGPHRHCTSQFCSANILDPSEYKTKHVDDDCDCSFIEPDTAEIRRAINVGDVPVVRASLRETTIHIDTQRAAFDVPYVAISHVWSGGLGNQWTSSLPVCQLRRIYHLLRVLTRPPTGVRRSKWYEIFKSGRSRSEKDAEQCADLFPAMESCVFWMDTLCLPKQRPQRDLAIGQMTRVYAGAQQVVVLDKGLQKMGVEKQEEEILANLVSSAWMSRCWTFQEGRMAQKLLINVAHSLRDPFVIYDQVATQAATFGPGKETWSDTFQFRRELASGLYRMRPFKDERIRSRAFEDFVDVWNELVSRTTSWPEDEIKILSLMLDLSVNEIESIPGDDMRLKAVFRSQGDLPISFLFVETASSCGSNDELWVPTNLTAVIDIRPGSMRKTMDIGTGEPGFILDLASDRSVIMRSTLRLSGHFLDVWMGEDGTERQDYTITLTFPEAASNESRVTTSLNDLYLLHKPGVPSRGLFGCSGRGCRFKIIKEDSTYMLVAYDCSFSYAPKLVAETRDAIESVGAISQQMERVVGRIDIRLRCGTLQSGYIILV